jgi:hypothetical protein
MYGSMGEEMYKISQEPNYKE